jgi:hypothetical protein
MSAQPDDLDAWREILARTCPGCGCRAVDDDGVCGACGASKRVASERARAVNRTELGASSGDVCTPALAGHPLEQLLGSARPKGPPRT